MDLVAKLQIQPGSTLALIDAPGISPPPLIT
jgi:hypothetical protein